tara:strand:- start:1414 stop:2181 length:768 start_codon:yes stop_codon:yes gene_type:complete
MSTVDSTVSQKEVEEDFLEVDDRINGQSYVLLSFVSPNKVLKRKGLFTFHKYLKHKNEEYESTFDEFVKEYDNFVYSHQENVNSEFNNLVDFQTSVRGLKVRGVYETYREAKIKAARLQKRDRSFHVFIGQVGYWLPWDPEPDGIEDQEYLNRELNTLIHEYKKNQEYRDEVFDKHVQNSKDAAAKEVEESKKSKEMTSSETANALEGDDPWIQRKQAEAPAPAQDSASRPTTGASRPTTGTILTGDPNTTVLEI